jgi:hypothetical protein
MVHVPIVHPTNPLELVDGDLERGGVHVDPVREVEVRDVGPLPGEQLPKLVG